jgi:hypothetical protein
MKPIRLKRDDVAHVVHTTPGRVRLATGAEVNKTLANPNGFGWPTCWRCTQRRMEETKLGTLVGAFGEATWVPVEGYEIVDQRANEEDLRATCTHGNPGGVEFVETKILTMPKTWSEVKKRQKRSALIFFVDAAMLPVTGNIVLL